MIDLHSHPRSAEIVTTPTILECAWRHPLRGGGGVGGEVVPRHGDEPMTHRAALSAGQGWPRTAHWIFPLDGTRESALPPFSSAQTLSGEDYSSRASLQYC